MKDVTNDNEIQNSKGENVVSRQVSDFIKWIITEKDKRGWDDSMLAARANLSPAIMSLVLSEQRKPGLSFCKGIAKAFNEPPENILRMAGLLPPLPAGENSPWLDRLMTVVKRLSPQDQVEVLRYAEFRNQVTAAGTEEKETLEKEELKAALANLSADELVEWADYLKKLTQKPRRKIQPFLQVQPREVVYVTKETG
jgi:hypothetical protein